jgi:hypothetical protein
VAASFYIESENATAWPRGEETMELREAYKGTPTKKDFVKIYEFQGKVKKMVQVMEDGQRVMKERVSRNRSICIAANDLFEALQHLRGYRPDFEPDHAYYRGVLYVRYRLPECSPLRTYPGEPLFEDASVQN